jgi:ATP-dependent helicase/nuclease subunit A
LIAAEEVLDLAEHWRLLYVGATRAKERLVVSGVKPRTRIAENSWHLRVNRALTAIGAGQDDPAGPLVYATNQGTVVAKVKAATRLLEPVQLPGWLRMPAPIEVRPSRPLAPSAITDGDLPIAPPSPAQAEAARRGILLHLLFERLPGVQENRRKATALHWLERSAGVDDAALRNSLADAACSLIGDPTYSDLFGPEALAEAPIAATLDDGRVIAGTVDRLLVEPGRVRVVDFKTGSRIPQSTAEVPRPHLTQMAAYAEALRVIFPGRAVEAALLYTAGPKLVRLDG